MNNRILPEFIEAVKVEETTFKVESNIRRMKRKTIGNRIKEARNLAGMNQTDLGDALGITQFAISRIENGEVALTVDNLEIIAETLKQPMVYFLGEDVGELTTGEFEWLQLYQTMPDEVKVMLAELVRGYIDRLRRQES